MKYKRYFMFDFTLIDWCLIWLIIFATNYQNDWMFAFTLFQIHDVGCLSLSKISEREKLIKRKERDTKTK